MSKGMPRTVTATAIVALLAVWLTGGNAVAATGTWFTYPGAWATYDPGANGVGTQADGFAGGVFDGRYVYFVPARGTTGQFSAEVLRYDTTCEFATPSCWATFDANAEIGAKGGYVGAAFDDTHGYIYFSPYANSSGVHGEVLRYNTACDFETPSCWQKYDPGAAGVGTDPDGFSGAVFDGQYVYFVPHYNGISHHGEVLRYDTTCDFFTPSCWSTFNAKAAPVGAKGGYWGAAFDRRFVYFVPWFDGSSYHGEVLRYDTTCAFSTPSCWSKYDAKAGIGAKGGYRDAAFDGQFVYFVPFGGNYGVHGEVLRYDTTSDFQTAASWDTYDYGVNCPTPNEFCTDPDGYVGATFDGRYMYFAPMENGLSTFHAEVLRYDTTMDFNVASSWATHDPGAIGGYAGAVFDGRSVYFVPSTAELSEWHGEVLRYDTHATIPAVSEWGLAAMTLLVLSAGTVVLVRRRVAA